MRINLNTLTILEASKLLEAKELSSLELCSLYNERVEKLDKEIKAFVHFDKDRVSKEATQSDKRRKEGKSLSKFDGIPLSVKDLICVKGQPCSCGSQILKGFKSPYDATVVSKLKENGFIIFGRNNMDEFAMGSTCENSSYYPTKNPWDYSRVPGGSSGGSAAAVSAGEIIGSLGSDTGGSVRQPSAFCGVVGLKPTYGRVSRFGLVSYASSLDQIGPITKDVTDSAILMDIISGHDIKDSTTFPQILHNCYDAVVNTPGNLKNIKIGIPKEYFEVGSLDSAIEKNFNKSIELLKDLGAEIVNVTLPHTKYAVASYYIIAAAEASANLARFDGVRYGHRTQHDDNLNELYLNSRMEGFGVEVKRRILLGTFVLSSGYHDAYYLKAQKVRTLIRKDFEKAFELCDVIVSPTSPTLPFKIGEITDPIQMYLADIYTISLNLAGICGISVPSDIIQTCNLPVDLQFIGPAMSENKLLAIAKMFEDNRQIKKFIPFNLIEYK